MGHWASLFGPLPDDATLLVTIIYFCNCCIKDRWLSSAYRGYQAWALPPPQISTDDFSSSENECYHRETPPLPTPANRKAYSVSWQGIKAVEETETVNQLTLQKKSSEPKIRQRENQNWISLLGPSPWNNPGNPTGKEEEKL